MKKKLCSCAVLAVILAVMLTITVTAEDTTVTFQNNSETVDLVFSDVLLEGTPTKIRRGATGFGQEIVPVGDSVYINEYHLTVPIGSTITEILLPGSHGRYEIIVEGVNGGILDFYSLYTTDELDTMIIAAAFAGNEENYVYYVSLRDRIQSGLKVNLTTQISYSGPKDKHSGLQRRETVYQICETGEYMLWFLPENSDGAAMLINLTVTDGMIPPEQIPQPLPEPETIPVFDPDVVAMPTNATVYVDGTEISFDAYSINDNNYFKLRDLAYSLRGSAKQFSVSWDESGNAIRLAAGEEYIAVGGEMTAKGNEEKTPVPTTAVILLNDENLNLTVYNIDGNNYFKLRDVGAVFDFNVSWDGENNAISINTGESYTDD